MSETQSMPRRAFAAERACLMLAEAGIRRFPLDCARLLRMFEGEICAVSFSEIPRITPDDNAMLETVVRDAWEIKRGGKCTIFFPDMTVSSGRYRFTVCHELGHCFLGHFDAPDLAKLNDSQRKQMDGEADIFASNMLCPAPVAMRLREDADGETLFGMSREAWAMRVKTAAQDFACISTDIAAETLERFAPYMYGRLCRACGANFTDTDRKNICPVCGGTHLDWKPQGKDDPE